MLPGRRWAQALIRSIPSADPIDNYISSFTIDYHRQLASSLFWDATHSQRRASTARQLECIVGSVGARKSRKRTVGAHVACAWYDGRPPGSRARRADRLQNTQLQIATGLHKRGRKTTVREHREKDASLSPLLWKLASRITRVKWTRIGSSHFGV